MLLLLQLEHVLDLTVFFYFPFELIQLLNSQKGSQLRSYPLRWTAVKCAGQDGQAKQVGTVQQLLQILVRVLAIILPHMYFPELSDVLFTCVIIRTFQLVF